MSQGKPFPPEVKALAREAYIDALVSIKRHPQKHVSKATGIEQRTISNWYRNEWLPDPEFMGAVKARVATLARQFESRAGEMTEQVCKLAKSQPTISAQFGDSSREVINPALEAKALAARTAIGALSVLARVAEKHDELGDLGGSDAEPTPQRASELVRKKFGRVTPDASSATPIEVTVTTGADGRSTTTTKVGG